MMLKHNRRVLKIALLLLSALLFVLPAPVRAACLVHVTGFDPQPLPEPCDGVLMAYDEARVSLITFDMALNTFLPGLPGLIWLLWSSLPAHDPIPTRFAPAPDAPPPRSLVASR